MGYQPNIPQATDQISVSQGDLLGNFQQLDNAFNLNHAALELASGAAGKHIFVEMPNQSASVPVTIANEVGLYCNTDANSGQPEMFFLKQSGSTAPAALINISFRVVMAPPCICPSIKKLFHRRCYTTILGALTLTMGSPAAQIFLISFVVDFY